MSKSVCADALLRFPLFPGKYCYPVSPKILETVYKGIRENKSEEAQGRNDQLVIILSTIGTPT